jgi:hypothetical protein
MDYSKNKGVLRGHYTRNGIINLFEQDNEYLEDAFNEITGIWFNNLDQINEIKYLIIAEAPLWGKSKSYIYNPNTPCTQFFYKSDLEYILDTQIKDKAEFIRLCNEIGLLIIDISPFALNSEDIIINYRNKSKNNPYGLTKQQYRELVELTIPFFFEKKIKAIVPKMSSDVKVFFRYARVKRRFQDLISEVLITNGLIKSENEILDVSKQGGGIDRLNLLSIMKND